MRAERTYPQKLSARATFKWDREDESYPVVQPEVKPTLEDCTSSSVAMGLLTEPELTIEIRRGICVHGGYRRHGFVDSARS
jgi:hypothetical protein